MTQKTMMIPGLFQTEATYFEVEPGDGTRYVGFYAFMPNRDLNLCFGTEGNNGAYVVPKNNLMYEIKNLARDISNGMNTIAAVQKMHLPAYWKSHTNIRNEWTTIAAVLFAATVYWGEPEDFVFVGYVYRNEYDAALEVLDTILTHPDFAPA